MSFDRQSEALSTEQQDAAISNTQPARPGARGIPPAGVPTQDDVKDKSTAPFVDSGINGPSQLQGQIPSTKDAQQASRNTLEAARQQVPSTQSISESARSGVESMRQQLPSAQAVSEQMPSSQGVLNSLSQGLSYVTSGVQNLAVTANNTSAPIVTTDHAKGRDAGDLEIPGKFPGDDDLPSPVQQGPVDSLDELKQNLPAGSSTSIRAGNVSSVGARENTRSEAGLGGAPVIASHQEQKYNLDSQSAPTTHQNPVLDDFNQRAKATIGGGAQSASSQLPSAQSVKQTVDNAANTAYQQLPSAQIIKETTSNNARSAQQSVNDAANFAYQQMPSSQTVGEKTGVNSAYQQIPSTQDVKASAQSAASTVQSGAYQAQAQVYQGAQAALGSIQSGLESTKEAVIGHQQARENEQIHKEGTDYIKNQIHGGNQGQVASEVPDVVAESRREGHWAPEAAANDRAVHEKSIVEQELVSKVGQAPASSETTASGGLSGNGIGVATTAAGVTEDGYWDGKPNSGVTTSSATSTIGAGSSLSYPHVGTEQTGSTSKENVEPTTGVRNPVTFDGTPVGDVVPGSGVHNGVVGSGAPPLPPVGKVDLSAGVHNGVIGAGSARAAGQESNYPKIGTAQAGSGLPHQTEEIPPVLQPKAGPQPGKGVAPLEHVDFGAGVHNGVSGAGSSRVPGQDPTYPRVGTSQAGSGLPNQSEEIPPVLVPKAGPQPGKGVAPIEDVGLSAGIKNTVIGSGSQPGSSLS